MYQRIRKTLMVAFPLLAGCTLSQQPLEVVDFVDLERYAGKWYEIASYPAPFQDGCTGTTANYTLLANGTVRVLNSCYDQSLDGPLRKATGKARSADPTTNARLKVSFFWPFEADYWIIDLGQDYEYAVVGVPNRRYLWILSRTPTMDEDDYQQILDRLPDQGYDPGKLVRTVQQVNSTTP